uniref:Amidohydrolase-related domain-containing protein n=1 Tax=Kwoniella dejecticola CBS 10117 TaxID=1296121 RepID=A0A1A6AH00_9TREE|nr:uncharacterized protein I303_01160 [Kwoniella dejecticola CBS 10117]OBR89334.1 hypothetical protein I303_01160 [Kwoniella dejecticola CBS 10117]
MTLNDITSNLGSFELIDQATSKDAEAGGSAYDWQPTHWLKFPVPESYDLSSPPWIRPEQVPMSFVGINVVDVENGKILPSMTVKIKSGKIQSISKSTVEHMQEKDWQSVRCQGLYLSPGLIDVHTHFTASPGQPNGQLVPASETQTALAATHVLKGKSSDVLFIPPLAMHFQAYKR